VVLALVAMLQADGMEVVQDLPRIMVTQHGILVAAAVLPIFESVELP
jgi:hypothetical protein